MTGVTVWMLAGGATAILVALVLVVLAIVLPRRDDAAQRDRRGLRQRAADTADRVLRERGWRNGLEERLELAGISLSPADVVLVVGMLSVGAVLLGSALAVLRPGPFAWLLPVLLVVAVVLGWRLHLERRTGRRRAAFAEQLDDTLSLIASGLRAGHSLPRAIDAVAHEAESPTAEEFARVLNEHRLGRDLNDALQLCADRMRSDDLSWVAQAVAIHRETGGNLSELLDHVGDTIRERNQIRRQVRILSAEGRISANVLIALPIGVAVILAFIAPSYVAVFVTTPIGWLLMGVSVVLFAIGLVWLRSITRIRF